MRIIIVLAAFLSAICTAAAAQEGDRKWHAFEPKITALEGYLEMVDFYGPPNYGENPDTDSIEIVFIVTLSTPISVRGGGDPLNAEDVQNVIQIQINCPVRKIDCAGHAGKPVRITGSLFTAHTGHHHTKILMNISEISEIE